MALGSHTFVGPYLSEMELVAWNNVLEHYHNRSSLRRISLIHSRIRGKTMNIPEMIFFVFDLTTKKVC